MRSCGTKLTGVSADGNSMSISVAAVGTAIATASRRVLTSARSAASAPLLRVSRRNLLPSATSATARTRTIIR